jgi:hypothetical protein
MGVLGICSVQEDYRRKGRLSSSQNVISMNLCIQLHSLYRNSQCQWSTVVRHFPISVVFLYIDKSRIIVVPCSLVLFHQLFLSSLSFLA